MSHDSPIVTPEVVVWMCFVEKVFIEISQNSQKNTCARISFLIKLQAFLIEHLWYLLLLFSVSPYGSRTIVLKENCPQPQN